MFLLNRIYKLNDVFQMNKLCRYQLRTFSSKKAVVRDPKYNFAPPIVDKTSKNIAEILGAIMWFWIFYRFKEDASIVFLGIHPWDLHHDAHSSH